MKRNAIRFFLAAATLALVMAVQAGGTGAPTTSLNRTNAAHHQAVRV